IGSADQLQLAHLNLGAGDDEAYVHSTGVYGHETWYFVNGEQGNDRIQMFVSGSIFDGVYGGLRNGGGDAGPNGGGGEQRRGRGGQRLPGRDGDGRDGGTWGVPDAGTPGGARQRRAPDVLPG